MYVGLIMMRMKMVSIFVIKVYMYNRKYDLKFYDIDFSLFIYIGVCEILLKRRRTKIWINNNNIPKPDKKIEEEELKFE